MRVRLQILLTAGLLAFVHAVPARALDLPVRDPARETLDGPAYRADVLEIRLRPAASRLAAGAVATARLAAPAGARARLALLGVPGVDRVAAALGGVRFEPEFRGEVPPPEGSDAPDLAAFYLVHLPAGTALEDALARFAAQPEVAVADPIAVLPVSVMPNDSLWSEAWWLHQASRADIHAPEAWDVSTGDPDVIVAILDTGVLPYHPDLGGTLAGSSGHLWVNAAEQSGVAGVDDDGNGWVDDVSGWDFVNLVSGAGIPPEEDWADEDPDPNDYAGHGTFVAGFADAIPDDGIGIPGAAWNVRVMPVRMAWATNTNPLGLVDMSFAAQAIHYAWKNGAHVINASWASLITNGLDTAALAALRAGVTIVSAAGNNGQPHELALFDDVIAVAATDRFDQLAGFSNRGPWVDVSAPGAEMVGPFVAHAGSDSLAARTPTYNTAGLGGTSFAAPLVSGAAALVHARRRALGLKPITPTGMRLRLRETSDDIAAQNPSGGFGAGRLRLDRALTDGPGSQALRSGATMIGAPVAVRTSAGETRIVGAFQNQRIVMFDGQDGDTAWVATTPGAPFGQIAAADMGAQGVCFFVGTSSGRIGGYDAKGQALPGWPVVVPEGLVQPTPALGDLDGDGIPEIVASGVTQVHAWHVDGSTVAGFPVGVFSPNQPVALADLDAQGGVEIVVQTGNYLYVIDGNGQVPAGWPVDLGAGAKQAPVVGRIRPFALPTILAVSGTLLHAFAPNGTDRWAPRDMGGSATASPALADLDGDGALEIVIATSAPALAAFDSLGLPLASRGWPLVLPSAASGHPVVGPLRPGGRPGVTAFRGGALYAFGDSAQALPGWPRLGATGSAPSLAELDDDGATELLAGTDPRALFYIHDAGPGTWRSTGLFWPTARGDFARTGFAGAGAPLIIPDLAPAAVTDLRVVAAGESTVTLQWTAVGEDGTTGRPAAYALRAASAPIDDAGFDAAPVQASVAASVDAGGTETAVLSGFAAGSTWWFAVKAVDRAAQRGAISNGVSATFSGGGPLAGRAGPAIAPRARPSGLPVALDWKGPGGPPSGPQRIELFDVTGRKIRVLPLGPEAEGVATWDGRTTFGDAVRPGMYFARLTSGSVHAQTRVVLLP